MDILFIATNLGNVVHTLVDKKNYRGAFLPDLNSAGKNLES